MVLKNSTPRPGSTTTITPSGIPVPLQSDASGNLLVDTSVSSTLLLPYFNTVLTASSIGSLIDATSAQLVSIAYLINAPSGVSGSASVTGSVGFQASNDGGVWVDLARTSVAAGPSANWYTGSFAADASYASYRLDVKVTTSVTGSPGGLVAVLSSSACTKG